MGNTGTGTVLDFGTPCTRPAVSQVFSIYGYIIKVIRILNIIFSLVFIIFSRSVDRVTTHTVTQPNLVACTSVLCPHHHMSIHSLLQVSKAYYGFVLQVLLTQIQGEYKIENQILIMLLQ